MGNDEEQETMRDYFAARALQGILADSNVVRSNEELAKWSYFMADAMMEARKEPPQ